MPSPHYGACGIVVDAVAMAVREAWACADRDRRVAVMQLALRRILGDELAGRALPPALQLLQLQTAAPAGDVEPAAVELTLCVRCRQVKLSDERRVYRGKHYLVYLRDQKWMERQFERLGRQDADVAKEIGCCQQSVVNWRNRHGIESGKQHRVWMQEGWLRKHLVDQKLAPGEVAAIAGCEVHSITQWARRLRVMPLTSLGKPIYAHHTREWWIERLSRTPVPTQYALAKMAGLKTHAVLFHLRKWGLYNPDRASKLRKPSIPMLYEPGWLAGMLLKKSRAQLARELGIPVGKVTYAERKLGLHVPPSDKPHPWVRDPEWWRAHFRVRATIEAMCAAAGGLSQKSALNYMGELGLLDEYHLEVERWSEEQLRRTRAAVSKRQAGRNRQLAVCA